MSAITLIATALGVITAFVALKAKYDSWVLQIAENRRTVVVIAQTLQYLLEVQSQPDPTWSPKALLRSMESQLPFLKPSD